MAHNIYGDLKVDRDILLGGAAGTAGQVVQSSGAAAACVFAAAPGGGPPSTPPYTWVASANNPSFSGPTVTNNIFDFGLMIAFNGAQDNGWWDVPNDRLVVPSGASGVYLITVAAEMDNLAVESEDVELQLLLGGTPIRSLITELGGADTGGRNNPMAFHCIVSLTEGQNLQLQKTSTTSRWNTLDWHVFRIAV